MNCFRKAAAATLALLLVLPVFSGGVRAEGFGVLSAEGSQTPSAAPSAAPGKQHPPTAGDLEIETVKNIAVTGTFAGADADGDVLTYQIRTSPKKGEAVVTPDAPGHFIYTPKENKTGSDSFTYVAVDTAGNVSAAATVKVRITKNAAKMTYADMEGNPAHLAAIRLAEKGVLIGQRLGADYYFSPAQTVTRGEFVALAVTCLGIPVPNATVTGFADDADTAAWLRPYAAAARRAGLISGSPLSDGRTAFCANREITLAEAAVILANALDLPGAVAAQDFGDMADVPVWAEGAVYASLAAGLMETRSDGSIGVLGRMDRATAAQLLYAAMKMQR